MAIPNFWKKSNANCVKREEGYQSLRLLQMNKTIAPNWIRKSL
jgi:hypothetical protein